MGTSFIVPAGELKQLDLLWITILTHVPFAAGKYRLKNPMKKPGLLRCEWALPARRQPFGIELFFPFGSVQLRGMCNDRDYARCEVIDKENAREARFRLI